jgi:hypothetical protein
MSRTYRLAAALCALPAPLAAQHAAGHDDMSGMTMPSGTADAAATGHDMAAMPSETNSDGMAGMTMGDGTSAYGSGTARLPFNDRMRGLHAMAGGWSLMAHGYAWGSYTDQGGPRGASKAFVQSMAMVQASRGIAAGTDLTLRAMLSADPLMGERGYPNLFATGETAHGQALIDRQHPHDLFMELSARIDREVGSATMFLYGGLPGEPALGPAAFMHRGSARFDPEAPITHHWFDSTHITYGVVTGGFAARHWQVEASAFKGREPGEDRTNIETPKLDSWSVRATWMASAALSAEVSYGHLNKPEALHPGQDEGRLIASVSYSAHGLDLTAAYSRKDLQPGRVLPAWFIEGTWAMTPRHAVFGRFENVLNSELFEREEQAGIDDPLADRAFRVSKFTAGYAYTLPLGRSFAVALGGAASAYAKSERLDAAYGRHPHSISLFAKLMLGR